MMFIPVGKAKSLTDLKISAPNDVANLSYSSDSLILDI